MFHIKSDSVLFRKMGDIYVKSSVIYGYNVFTSPVWPTEVEIPAIVSSVFGSYYNRVG